MLPFTPYIHTAGQWALDPHTHLVTRTPMLLYRAPKHVIPTYRNPGTPACSPGPARHGAKPLEGPPARHQLHHTRNGVMWRAGHLRLPDMQMDGHYHALDAGNRPLTGASMMLYQLLHVQPRPPGRCLARLDAVCGGVKWPPLHTHAASRPRRCCWSQCHPTHSQAH
jgi:hypothetical protein